MITIGSVSIDLAEILKQGTPFLGAAASAVATIAALYMGRRRRPQDVGTDSTESRGDAP